MIELSGAWPAFWCRERRLITASLTLVSKLLYREQHVKEVNDSSEVRRDAGRVESSPSLGSGKGGGGLGK